MLPAICAICDVELLDFLAGRDPHDLDGVADHEKNQECCG
jgi:hypothetical protein